MSGQIRDDTKPCGWPDKCANCGAHWSKIGFDYALGFNCRSCGACDGDETTHTPPALSGNETP